MKSRIKWDDETQFELPRPNTRARIRPPEWLNLTANGVLLRYTTGRDSVARRRRPREGPSPCPPDQSAAVRIGYKSVHERSGTRALSRCRTVGVPATSCYISAVDYSATLWVNGRRRAQPGGTSPFIRHRTLRWGARIRRPEFEDYRTPAPRAASSPSGMPHDIDYYCTTGVLADVCWSRYRTVRIEEIRITPLR